MVCIEATPTVTVHLVIPVPIARGGWAWGEHPDYPGSLANEYAYNGREVCALARTYGTAISRMIKPCSAERFAIVVRSWFYRTVVARQEWEWSASRHAYYAPEEPWDTSAEAIRQYWERNGQMITAQKFRARIDGYPPSHDRRYEQAANALRLLRGGTATNARNRGARKPGGQAA